MGRSEAPVLVGVIPFYNEQRLIYSALQAIYSQQERPSNFRLILVDNSSTDHSRGEIDRFITEHPGLPISVIEENRKGTGCAAATGFAEAIRLGADIIARTDADCMPSPGWIGAGLLAMHSPSTQLSAGPVRPRRDDGHYRHSDAVVWPTICVAGKAAYALLHPEAGLGSFIYAPGGNTFVRASAYEAVGGYPLTSIAESDEDVVLSLHIKQQYGLRAMRWSWQQVVYASMRRQRHLNLRQLFDCYVLRPNNATVRLRVNQGNIDVR